MPRVTPAHEEAAKRRIAEGALRAFLAHGLHDATMQDVVRETGASVGAIYTWFSGKDELVRAACELALQEDLAALASILEPLEGVRLKMEAAVDFWLDRIADQPLARVMVEAWVEGTTEPAVVEMLHRRRERLAGVAALLLQEGIATGEIDPHVPVDTLAHGFVALLEGLILQRLEQGASFRAEATRRQALVFVDLVLARAPQPAR
jgi:AcrR family transcriptional regulator